MSLETSRPRRGAVLFTFERCFQWQPEICRPPGLPDWPVPRQDVWHVECGITGLTPLGWEALRVSAGLSRSPHPLPPATLLGLFYRGRERLPHLHLSTPAQCRWLDALLAKACHLVWGLVPYRRGLGWLHAGLFEPDQERVQGVQVPAWGLGLAKADPRRPWTVLPAGRGHQRGRS
jgi:hypothetical protein